MPTRVWITILVWVVFLSVLPPARAADTGFQPEIAVKQATRLDWEFVAGADADKLPAEYDSRRQRYQLFVPPEYKPNRIWPLVVFISPGDDPLGWRAWQEPCEKGQVLFCAAYGAGNGASLPRRIRTVLDVLDDVRQRFRIDPDRTYLAGMGGGAPVACAIGFSLPEYFGGVIAVGGGADLPPLAHLRHRVRDRLSVALVAGEVDFARRDLERFFGPLLGDLQVRTHTWLVAEAGHGLPPASVVTQVHAWLDQDRKRRHEEGRLRPGLTVSPDEVTPRRLLASRGLSLAETELRKPDRISHAVALLEWITLRCERTQGGDKASELLQEIKKDPVRGRQWQKQAGLEERAILSARARAFENAEELAAALDAWQKLERDHPGSPEARKATAEILRLGALQARTPYLGAATEAEGPTLGAVVPGSPAEAGGLQVGDRVVQVGDRKVASAQDLRQAVLAFRPGDKVAFTVRRAGKTLTLSVLLGALPLKDREL